MTQAVPKPAKRKKKKPNPGHPYLTWLHKWPCHLTGNGNVEAAHVQGPASLKTGLVLPRRKGAAYLSAIPLSPEKHRLDEDSIERMGEEAWGLHHFGRGDAAVRIAFAYLATFELEKSKLPT